MRILVATDQWYPDVRGGVARVASETATRLAARGHDVTVLAPRVRGEQAEERAGKLVVLRALRRSVMPQTVSDVVGTYAHARRLGKARFDVAVAHQSTTATGLSCASTGAPIVLVYHASALRELRFNRSRLRPGRQKLAAYALEPPLAALESVAIRAAERILVLSEFTRSLLREDHPGHAASAPRVSAGVDVETFSPGDGTEAARARLGLCPGGPLLVTVRRLEPRMGLDRLLEAVVSLRRSREVRLAVVGVGSLERALRGRAAALGIGEAVQFAGRVSDQVLVDWYRAADAFVLPTTAYEGFGMATLEALASGTPVIATPAGATPELLRPLEPRLLAKGVGSDDIASAIEEALPIIGPDLRERTRAYAVSRFSWNVVMGAWEEQIAGAARGITVRSSDSGRTGPSTGAETPPVL